nr:DNA repair protein RAD51 homolog 4-like [Procambarus clarkii]
MRLCVGLCPALTEDVLSKLHKAGIRNILSFMLKDPELLAMEISVSYKDLQSIRRIIHAHYAAFAVSGDDMLNEAVQRAVVISTGNTNLDTLLGGGLMTGEVMEVCGGWGAGKTSLCVSLAVHAALRLKMNVLYIDPLGSINSLRLAPVIEAFSEKLEIVEHALACIKTVAPADIWGVFQALELARQPYLAVRKKDADCGGGDETSSIVTTVGKIQLVIVDSLPSVLTPFLGGQQKQGWGIINQLAAALKSLASEQQLAIVVVNSVVHTNYNNNVKNQGYNLQTNWKPALGRFWDHVPHVRLFVETETRSSAPQNLENCSLSPSEMNVSILKSTRLKIRKTKISIFPAL